jgi:hypothetical protein
MKKNVFFVFLCFLAISSYEQVLNAVTPSSASQGQTLAVSISGSNTHFTQASNTTIWFEQGSSTAVFASSFQAINATTINATIQLSAQQPVGLYNLHVYNNIDGNLMLSNSFAVNTNASQAQLVGITPSSATQGTSLNVTISGQNTHFNQGTSTITWFQQGSSTVIYPNSQNSTSATTMTANYTIPTNAVTGYYNTYTYNDVDGMLMLNSSFYINSPLNTYLIQGTANPIYAGSVAGAGNINSGQICSLNATSYSGYYFLNWTENGNIVSNNLNYTFIVYSNRSIVANFNQIISVPEINDNNNIILYPNPACNYFNICLNTEIEKNTIVEVYDILGKLIVSQISTNEALIKVNIEGFEKGVYYIAVMQKNKIILTKKLIIK